MVNGRFKGISKSLKPYLPGSTDEWDADGWVQQEEQMLERMETQYVETLTKQHPLRGAEGELRRRYEAGELAEAEYLAKRRELHGKAWGWE